MCLSRLLHVAKCHFPQGVASDSPTSVSHTQNIDPKQRQKKSWADGLEKEKRDIAYFHLCNVRYAPRYLMNAKDG